MPPGQKRMPCSGLQVSVPKGRGTAGGAGSTGRPAAAAGPGPGGQDADGGRADEGRRQDAGPGPPGRPPHRAATTDSKRSTWSATMRRAEK